MTLNLLQKMLCILLLSALTSAFNHFNIRARDNTRIVFENREESTRLPPPEISRTTPTSSSLIFPDDPIYFPARRLENYIRTKYENHRLTLPEQFSQRFSFYRNFMKPVLNSVNSASKLAQKSENIRQAAEQSNAAPDKELKSTKPQGENIAPLSRLQQWLRANINSFRNPEQNAVNTESGEVGQPIGFQSLLQLPGLKGKSNSDGCPPNQRRNHRGICTRPFKIILFEDDLKS